jgi:hypothetical protein
MSTMNNKDLLGGLLLIAIALFFGVQSLQYSLGQLNHMGPGLFPLAVSIVVLLIGILNVIRSRFVERVPVSFNLRSIAAIIGALVAFVTLSEFVNMILGIIALVFCATIGGSSYSVRRNIGITAGLIVIAFGFQKLFQLDLPLY